MKTRFSSIRAFMTIAGSVLTIGILLTGCLKKNDLGPNTPYAGLMAFNLIPDKDGIGIAIDNNSLTQSPLTYTSFTGGYLNAYIGQRTIGAFNPASDSLFTKNTVTLDTSKYYSLFVVGANGTYSNVFVRDNFDAIPPSSGQAYIRYINAIPDSSKPLVNVTAGGNNVINTNAGFATISDFVPITPGDATVGVNDGTADIHASRTITVEPNRIYTLLLIGQPNATDSSKTVQVRIITNGSL